MVNRPNCVLTLKIRQAFGYPQWGKPRLTEQLFPAIHNFLNEAYPPH
jgi:hypothetical protein